MTKFMYVWLFLYAIVIGFEWLSPYKGTFILQALNIVFLTGALVLFLLNMKPRKEK
ncbi:MAG TPA: hypothetical protein VIR13_01350 [Savagea sp.]